jgi:hypothetical protein
VLHNNFVHPCLVAYVTFCMFVSVASTVPLLQPAPALGMQCTRQELVRDCALPSLLRLNKIVTLMCTASSSVSAQMTCN